MAKTIYIAHEINNQGLVDPDTITPFNDKGEAESWCKETKAYYKERLPWKSDVQFEIREYYI